MKTYRYIRSIFQSPEQAETDILALFEANPDQEFTGADIWNRLGIGAGHRYPALVSLEQRGKIKSQWAEGPYPRKRIYQLKRQV